MTTTRSGLSWPSKPSNTSTPSTHKEQSHVSGSQLGHQRPHRHLLRPISDVHHSERPYQLQDDTGPPYRRALRRGRSSYRAGRRARRNPERRAPRGCSSSSATRSPTRTASSAASGSTKSWASARRVSTSSRSSRASKACSSNPSMRARERFPIFAEVSGFGFLKDGRMGAFKAVRADFTDIHSGKFDNSPGKVVSMPREDVDDDPEKTCSAGFHLGALSYVQDFGHITTNARHHQQGRLLRVLAGARRLGAGRLRRQEDARLAVRGARRSRAGARCRSSSRRDR